MQGEYLIVSWAEVKKLNSDFTNEPLNFSHYVSDISSQGANSYVLLHKNNHLWRLLLLSSLLMFGHTAIHNVIYNRLSNSTSTFDPVNNDCDYTLNCNARLGLCFNGFYDTDVFSEGSINTVLSTMLNSHFNILEVKWQLSLCRYLTLHTLGSSGVGAWLALVYDEPSLSSYATLESILGDSTLWEPSGILMTNEPLRVGCCSSSVGLAYAGSSSTATWFNNYVNTVAETTVTTTELWDQLQANSALDSFWTNDTASGYIFDKQPSMLALIYHPHAFKSLCGSTAGIATLCNHTSLYNTLFGGWNTSGNSEAKLIAIRSTMSTLNTLVSQMPSDSHNIVKIGVAQTAIADAITDVLTMNSKADVLAANFNALNTSSTAWNGIANSTTAVTAIVNNTTAMNKVAASTTAMNAIATSIIAMTIIANTQTALNIIAASTTACAALYNKASKYSGNGGAWSSSGRTISLKGILVGFKNDSSDNALTLLKLDSTVITGDHLTRNCVDNNTNFKYWISRFPSKCVFRTSLTIASYYSHTIYYIPIN